MTPLATEWAIQCQSMAAFCAKEARNFIEVARNPATSWGEVQDYANRAIERQQDAKVWASKAQNCMGLWD
jgi:hypothetical protein